MQNTLQLQDSLKVDRVIACLLESRGIHSFEAAKNFFRPDLRQLHDPFLMKGMRVAIDRINQAIDANEKVLIYGDYDVDGTTAVSVVYSFFKPYIQNIRYYIPDRYKEGYGISFASIDYAVGMSFEQRLATNYKDAIDREDWQAVKDYDKAFLSKIVADKQEVDMTSNGQTMNVGFTFPSIELSEWKNESN